MADNEDDLYDFALGSDYSSVPNEPSTSSTPPIEKEEQIPKDSKQFAALFRELLVESRGMINKLKAENEQLKTNLENAIASGGVMICPNCTHHFKDRQCPLRPKSMKKMRARNCVELEFSNLEDLTAWLYLNQLETNNDELPTVMKVKTTDDTKKKSLKDVGSLLPSLVEKNNQKKNEERRTPIKLKIKKDSGGETIPVQQKRELGRGKEEMKSKEKYDERKEKRNGNERDKEQKEMKTREERDEERRKKKRRQEKERRERIAEKKKMMTSQVSDETDNKTKQPSDPVPQKTEPPKDKERVVHTSERETYRDEERKKPNILSRLEYPTAKRSHSPTETTPPIKPKRSAIVWEEVPPEPVVGAAVKAAKPFEFKIPEKKSVPKVSAGAPAVQPKKKYTFVPTSQKKLVAHQPVRDVSPSVEESVVPGPSLNELSVDTQTSVNPSQSRGKREPSASQPQEEQISPTWRLIPIKKSESVIQHIEDHALRRRSDPRITGTDSHMNAEEEEAGVAEKRFTLKSIGISDEGLAIWENQLKNKDFSSASRNVKLPLGDLNRLICNTESTKTSFHGSSASSPMSYGSFENPPSAAAVFGRDYVAYQAIPGNSNSVATTEVTSQNWTTVSQSHSVESSSRSSIQLNQEDQDLLDEFFPSMNPGLVSKMLPETSPSLTENPVNNMPCSQTDTDSETISVRSVDDREENELLDLMREESVVSPDGDYLPHDEDLDKTIVPNNVQDDDVENDSTMRSLSRGSDYRDFCLEDVEDFGDEAMRARKFSNSSIEGSSHCSEEVMDWSNEGEEEKTVEDDGDEHFEDDYAGVNPLEESDLVEPPGERNNYMDLDDNDDERPNPSVSKTNDDLHLSNHDELESPMTSTPKHEDAESDEDFKPCTRDDVDVEELDWNYSMDEFEDKDGGEENNPDNEAAETNQEEQGVDEQKNGEVLEDGEISDEEKKMISKVEKSPKKQPMRERIRYVVEEKQVNVDLSDSDDDYEPFKERGDNREGNRNHHSSRHRNRRSSEENQEHYSRHERRRPHDRSSHLKNRN